MIPAEGGGELAGAEVRTPDDGLLGTVDQVVGQHGGGGVVWASVATAPDVDRDRPVVVPLANAVAEDDAVRLPFGQQTVLGAPQPAAPDAMTHHERTALERWYGAFTSTESAQGWVAPQDLPDVPFTLDDGPGTP